MTTSTITTNRRNHVTHRKKLVLAGMAGAAVIVGALLLGNAAYAGEPGPARRGQPCPVEGSYARDRSGNLYICEQREGQPCPVWHAAEPRPGDLGKPSPCVCPSKSPSGSPSSSPSTSATAPTQPAPSLTPAGHNTPTLPVTGTRVVVLVGAGAFLLLGTRRRNT